MSSSTGAAIANAINGAAWTVDIYASQAWRLDVRDPGMGRPGPSPPWVLTASSLCVSTLVSSSERDTCYNGAEPTLVTQFALITPLEALCPNTVPSRVSAPTYRFGGGYSSFYSTGNPKES